MHCSRPRSIDCSAINAGLEMAHEQFRSCSLRRCIRASRRWQTRPEPSPSSDRDDHPGVELGVHRRLSRQRWAAGNRRKLSSGRGWPSMGCERLPSSTSALLLLGGAAGDRFGRRRLLIAGVSLFGLASLACAAAPNLPLLLIARFIQGASAAVLMPNSLAILGQSFTGEAKGRAVGIGPQPVPPPEQSAQS